MRRGQTRHMPKPLAVKPHSTRGMGEFSDSHMMIVDSKGNIVVGESVHGRRIQMFRFVGH
jgi:hypothetical protein